MDWFLYDNGLRHERVNLVFTLLTIVDSSKKDGKININFSFFVFKCLMHSL